MLKQEHFVGFHVEKSEKKVYLLILRSSTQTVALAGRVIFLIRFAFSGFIRYSPASAYTISRSRRKARSNAMAYYNDMSELCYFDVIMSHGLTFFSPYS